MKERLNRTMPSAAMVVALLAFGIAIGGGAYAAKLKLKKNAVKTKNIKNNAVTEPKLADKAVSAAKLGDKSVTAAKLADGAVTTASLAPCKAGTLLFAGQCYETTPHAADNWFKASEDCGAKGGRLPLSGELLAVRDQPGIDLGTLASTDNWAAEQIGNDAGAVADNGGVSLTLAANVTNRPYRCVFPRG